MSEPSEKDTFTVNWSIDNFSMCTLKSRQFLRSPKFMMNLLGTTTEWYLELYPNGYQTDSKLSCFLCRVKRKKLCEAVTVGFSFTIVAAADISSEIKKVVESCTFSDIKSCCGFYKFADTEEFLKIKDVLTLNDVLTVTCCIWRVANDLPYVEIATSAKKSAISHVLFENATFCSVLSEQLFAYTKEELEEFSKPLMPNRCSARTRIELERRSITWPIKRFSKRRPNRKIFLPVVSAQMFSPLFIMSLHVTEDEDVQIEIQHNIYEEHVFVRCTITVLNVQTEVIDSATDEHFFDADVEHDVWQFPLFIKRHEFLAKNGMRLKNDTLLLRCNFVLSHEREIKTDFNVFYPRSESHDSSPNRVTELSGLLLSTYKDQKFCDVSLRVGDRTISAHKGIICPASPVFTAMFENNMKEKLTGVVDIPDVDSDTLDRMLNYIYSGLLEDMQQEDVMKLYSASDKYQVLPLRKRCSSLLLSALSVPNVCEVLKFVVIHQDHELKTAVQDFISIRSKEVFRSKEWKDFMEGNAVVAGEVMYQVLMNS